MFLSRQNLPDLARSLNLLPHGRRAGALPLWSHLCLCYPTQSTSIYPQALVFGAPRSNFRESSPLGENKSSRI